MKLTPRQLDKLQPHEFEKILEAALAQRDREQEETAYFVYILGGAIITKKMKSPKDILRPLQPHNSKGKEVSQEEKEYFKKMAASIEAKQGGR